MDTIGDSPVRVATTIKQYCIQDPSAGHSAGRSSVRDTMILDLLKDLAVKNAVQSNNQIESSIDSTTVIASNPVSKLPKVIIFVERKRDADHYVRLLSLNGLSTVDSEGHRRKYTAAALHGDISQVTRERTLNQFRKGYLDCLVCTDVAARGLDIPSVDIVLQLEPPTSPETYIHRVGRTGRAGNSGVSIIFYSPSEHGFAMAAIQEIIGKKFIIYKPSVKSPQVRFNDSSASDHI